MQALLAFDQAPPFSVPARFFLTAPLFAAAAGLLLIIDGPAIVGSRWGTSTLALTHLFTAGFMLQVMLGALFQIMPVVAGANLPRSRRFAGFVHLTTAVGAAALVLGFLLGRVWLFHLAGTLLAAGVFVFLAGAARALFKVPNTSPTIPALKLALTGLGVTVLLGLLLLGGLLGKAAMPLPVLTDLHAAWGLLGWSAVLVAGVAYVVVPMFQLTPGFPARFSRFFALVLTGLVVLWSVARWFEAGAAVWLLQLLLAGALAAFALMTLRLQARSKRSRADTTFRFWQLAMACTLLAALGFGLAGWLPGFPGSERLAFVVGALAIFGAFASVISGMLYKIVPFLSWLHLQNAGGKGRVPHMGSYLHETAMRRQMLAHAVALAGLLGAVVMPVLAQMAGVALIVSAVLLLMNLASVLRRYAALRSAALTS